MLLCLYWRGRAPYVYARPRPHRFGYIIEASGKGTLMDDSVASDDGLANPFNDDLRHDAATDLDVCWFQTKDGGTDHRTITFNFSKRCRRSRWAAKTTFFGVFWPGSRARLPPRSEWTVPPCQPRVGVGEKCHRWLNSTIVGRSTGCRAPKFRFGSYVRSLPARSQTKIIVRLC